MAKPIKKYWESTFTPPPRFVIGYKQADVLYVSPNKKKDSNA
tara:strand:+ start:718 stop:843 length:126 start_codon:yes stop_codon:yes gene_type:complete